MSKSLLTDEIILKALRADVGEASLISWDVENASKFGDNFFNDNKRIKVTFEQNNEKKNTSYFAKLNPQKVGDIFNPYRNHAMKKEIFFYFELLPILNKELESINKENLRVPRCFAFSLESEKEIIILEDLSIKGFVTFDRKYEMDDDHTVLMNEELAKFHTSSILLQRKKAGKPLTDIFPLLVEAWNEPDDKLSEGFLKIFKKAMVDNINYAKNLPEFREIIPLLDNIFNRPMETVKRHLQAASKLMEICHGDYHRTNVLFKYEKNKPIDIMVIDWQTIRLAPIGSELGYFLHSCYMGEQKEKFESMIISPFHKLLSTNLQGHVPYTLEELDIHCNSNFFGFLISFFFIPMSVCVKSATELFQVTDKDLRSTPDGIKNAGDTLAENQVLRKIIIDIFNYIVKHQLDKKI